MTNASTPAFDGELYLTTQCVCVIIGVLAVLVGCFGNGLVFLAAVERRAFHNKVNTLILSLSTADFILCAFITPMCIYLLFANPPKPTVFCGVLQFIGSSCAMVSLLTLVAIAMHRQARIIFHVKNKLTLRQSLSTVLFLWLISIATTLTGTLFSMQSWKVGVTNCLPILNSSNIHSNNFILFFMGPVCCISFVMIVISYCVIAFTVQNQCGAKTHQHCGAKLNRQSSAMVPRTGHLTVLDKHLLPATYVTSSTEKDIKAISMCILVTMVILLCWGPLIVAQLVEVVIGQSNMLFQIKVSGVLLILLNSALNPYIYAQRSSKIKLQLREISNIIFHCKSQNTPVESPGKGKLQQKKSSRFDDTAISPLPAPGQVDKYVFPISGNRTFIQNSKGAVTPRSIYANNILTTPDRDSCASCIKNIDLKSNSAATSKLLSTLEVKSTKPRQVSNRCDHAGNELLKTTHMQRDISCKSE